MKKNFLIFLIILLMSPTSLFSNEKDKNSEELIKPKIIKTKIVIKRDKYERKSPLLAYLDRIERRLSENKKYPMSRCYKYKLVKRIKEKLSRNRKRKQYLLKRINRIKKDLNEIDLFNKLANDILKRLDTIKTVGDDCKKRKRK